MKRNGLSGRVARGTNRLRARECSSPWLITPRAAPATPSTVTSRTTRRRVPSPVSWIRPSSTWLCWRRCSQIPAAFSAMGPKRSSRIPAAAFLSQASAALQALEVRGSAHRPRARPASQLATSAVTGRQASSRRSSSARAVSRRRRTASRRGPLADSTWRASSSRSGDRAAPAPRPRGPRPARAGPAPPRPPAGGRRPSRTARSSQRCRAASARS